MAQFFDCKDPYIGAIRDANCMEYNLCGLVTTPEYFESFLQAMNSTATADQRECRQLLTSIHPKHAWCITAKTLDEIEVLWTGHSREHGYQLNHLSCML